MPGRQPKPCQPPSRWPIRLALAAVLLVQLAPGGAAAAPALLFDAASGRVLHAHQAAERWYPASLAKLMTLYLVFEAIRAGQVARDAPVAISARAAAEPFNNTGWPVGRSVALEAAVPLLIVKSANDLAVAVAETVAGDVEAFVAAMNRKAAALGMADSRFANPNGIHDPGQYTTARDLALLAAALIRDFPEERRHFAAASARLDGEMVASPNRLLDRLDGADGIKTGYLCASGWNIVASATRGGTTLVAIVLGALREGERERVAGELLEAGFKAMESGAGQGPVVADLGSRAPAAEPIDMRPYACQGLRPPAAIASFGLEGGEAPLPRLRP